MMLTMNYMLLALLLFCQNISHSYGFYYWKDYQKGIPLNAYSAGTDSNHDKVYIGQAFFDEDTFQGIYPTNIHINKDVYVPRYGPRKADNFVQILCITNPENFEWILTNSTHFHLMETKNELVRGGIEYHEWISIGRVKIQGQTSVGKVMSADIGRADMWFVHDGEEKKAEIFEVLTYNYKQNYMKGKKP